jgi:hypothetical protein
MSDQHGRRTIHGMDPNDAAHREIDPRTGMQRDYVVLSEEERRKGFVRPVRRSYVHVGCRPQHPTRPLTPEEIERYGDQGYVLYEPYPASESSVVGRFWTDAQLHSGCGTATTMGVALAETYAREPKFYSGTFCARCKAHFPVGADGEFEWEDGTRVGT